MIDTGFQDIVCQARKLLLDSPFQGLQEIEVAKDGESVYLRGVVTTFFLKQVAQETVRSATRGLDVHNELSVHAVAGQADAVRRKVH